MRHMALMVLSAALAASAGAADLSQPEARRFKKAVQEFIQANRDENDGVFTLRDEKLDKDWRLTLVKLHDESVARLSDRLYSAPAEFKQAGGKARVEVDFQVNKTESGFVVRQALVRSVDGVVRGGAATAAPGLQRQAVAKASYACPMGHYSSDKPGKCPKCGMDLQQASQ